MCARLYQASSAGLMTKRNDTTERRAEAEILDLLATADLSSNALQRIRDEAARQLASSQAQPFIELSPSQFFAFFDRNVNQLSHDCLREYFQEWLSGQHGKSFGSLTRNKSFAVNVRERAS